MARAGRPPSFHSRLKCEAAHADDARDGLWPREKLERMDARFIQRVEKAIASGQEQPLQFHEMKKPPAGGFAR
jgi:hypothetical protein